MKENKKSAILLGILGFAIGVIGGIALIPALEHFNYDGAPWWYPMFEVGILFLAMGIQTVVHEGGHLLFGLMTGYKFCSFRIASFMIAKVGDKIKFKRFKLAGTGGQCLMAPPEFEEGKFPVVWFNLGGSVLNILLSGIAFLINIFVENTVVSMFCVFFGAVGIFFGLFNGIPLKTPLINNDGHNALSLSKDPKAAKAFWLQLKVNEMQTNGLRLKDMPDEWFEVPSDEDMKNSVISAIGVFNCNRLVDSQKFEEAEKETERLLALESGIVGIHKALLTSDLIYLKLVLDRDFDDVCKLFTKETEAFMNSMKNIPGVIRTRYAYALLGERNKENAEKFKTAFEKSIKTYPFEGDVESERDLIAFADSKAKI